MCNDPRRASFDDEDDDDSILMGGLLANPFSKESHCAATLGIEFIAWILSSRVHVIIGAGALYHRRYHHHQHHGSPPREKEGEGRT